MTQSYKAASTRARAPALIDVVDILHGPAVLLGRVFLIADQLVAQAGLRLELATMGDLLAANRLHEASWGPLVPALDESYSSIPEDSAFCLTCTQRDGTIVATQAERYYNLTDTTLASALTGGIIFGPKQPSVSTDDACTTTAPSATILSGPLSYSGAIWVRPDYRQLRLAHVLLRASRALAYTRWATRYNIGLIKKESENSAVHQRYGYAHSEHEFCFWRNGSRFYDGLLLWMDAPEMEADFSDFVERVGPELAARNGARGIQQQAAAR
jgi:hypothetical protein